MSESRISSVVEPVRGVRTVNGGKSRHPVGCIYCSRVFDLLTARWCEHGSRQPSKECTHCGRCLCGHPMYGWPHLWREATPLLRRHGFRKMFVLYSKLFVPDAGETR